MKVLITGGAGFIGSHIAERALASGWDVAVVDNLASGTRENVPSGAQFHKVDICDKAALAAVFRDFQPTHVSHQAAQASVAVSVREPQLDASINIIGSINVLSACVDTGVSRIVFASTGGAIYGEVPDGTTAGIDTVPVPVSPYACSKFAVEKYLECYRVEHGLPYTILRYANVYGPRQDPHGEAGVVAIFCNRILAGDDIQVNARSTPGDDGCVRDYVYIDDVVNANITALEGHVAEPVMNVGTGNESTTSQLADELQTSLNRKVTVRTSVKRPGDIERSVLNVEPLVGLLGSPVPLTEGLKRTAAWFQQRKYPT